MTDLDLLRAYEPILRFTYGELFFPCAVEPYVRECELWESIPGRPPKLLVPLGELDLDVLASVGEAHANRALYLRFVQEPLDRLDYQRWARRRDRPHFYTPGRLARVGLVPRLIDAVFSLSLFLRGSVPGGTAATAAVKYQEVMTREPRYVYHGRVVRQAGYVILQYLFFYAMNDWRSTFHGANDHEADWEQVLIYLEEHDGRPPTPAWVACAAHGGSGDDLRRRWDDPELTRVGDHPVVFVGAGSHASYFLPGEYLASFEAKFLRPLLSVVQIGERFWRRTLRQGDRHELADRVEGFISVPFIDYARGDGVVIGPGQGAEWSPTVIGDGIPWVESYRGLWGRETQDPFAVEQAPAGPKFYPDGTIRHTWHSPLGWAGLDKVPPPEAAVRVLANHISDLEQELAAVEADIADLRHTLPGIELEVRALREVHHLHRLLRARETQLVERDARLQRLQDRRVELQETLRASRRYLERLAAGERPDPRAHIRRAQLPQTESNLLQSRLAEAWAALSVGVPLIGVAAFVILGIGGWLLALVVLLGMSAVVEATLRGRLHKLLLNVTIVLAVIASVILIYEFAWQMLLVGIVAVAGLIIADNLRELRGR